MAQLELFPEFTDPCQPRRAATVALLEAVEATAPLYDAILNAARPDLAPCPSSCHCVGALALAYDTAEHALRGLLAAIPGTWEDLR